jgi:hypothetical protein
MTEGNSKTKRERTELGRRVNLTANDVASPPIQEKGKATLEAVENWLRETLVKGPVLYETIEGDAKGLVHLPRNSYTPQAVKGLPA